MTADDAAWTINTTIKYGAGATAVQAASLNHAKRALAPNSTTLVLNYSAPVSNALFLLAGVPMVPRHFWEPLEKKEKAGGGAQDVPAAGPPADGHGRGLHREEVREEGLDAVHPGSELLRAEVQRRRGRAPVLHERRRDDRRPAAGQPRLDRPGALQRRERGQEEQGREGQRVAGRRDHEHHVELEPAEAQEPRAARPAGEEGALDVRRPRQDDPGRLQRLRLEGGEPRRAHLAAREPQPRADEVQLRRREQGARRARLQAGLGRHPRRTGDQGQVRAGRTSRCATTSSRRPRPTSTSTGWPRSCKEGFAKLGVKVTQKVGGDSTASYAIETDSKCDASKNIGYSKFDIAMWDWIPVSRAGLTAIGW